MADLTRNRNESWRGVFERRNLMNLNRGLKKSGFIAIWLALTILTALPAAAAVSPVAPYQASTLGNADPAVFTYQASIAHYDSRLIYAGADGKIYAFDPDSATSTLVSDTSLLKTDFSAVTGFMVSSGDYLYFHDNGISSKIFRLRLTNPWPAAYESFDTLCSGYIYAFTQNPWTGAVWFSSAEFGGNMYLYEINAAFTGATLRASFAQPNGGGSGPIIFKNKNTVLYGESVFGGNGFFHLINALTGDLIEQDYLTFTSGLASAAYGYNHTINVATGAGKSILAIQDDDKTPLAATGEEAGGLSFGDDAFYLSEMVPYSGGPNDGAVSFDKLWNPDAVMWNDPAGSYQARLIGAPDPAVQTWNSSIAYYSNQIIYYDSGNGAINGYNLDTGETRQLCQPDLQSANAFGAAGFVVGNDGYLYFHDNGFPTQFIFRLDLADPGQGCESLNTRAAGSIFSLTVNPWSGAVFFSSSDTTHMYLYEVSADFTAVTEKFSFEKRHSNRSSGSGPIIFKDADTILYGEVDGLFDGNDKGYFHLVNASTGVIIAQDYLSFDGGLAGAVRDADNRIYVTTGGGNAVYEIEDDSKTPIEIDTTAEQAGGIAFDGTSLLVSQLKMSDFSGTVNFHQLWMPASSGVPADQVVDDSVDLNGDGVPDNTQLDVIMSVTTDGGTGSRQIGVSSASSDAIVASVESMDANSIAETKNRPSEFPFGLVNFKLTVKTPGDTATVIIYLSEPAPANARWYQYDPINGWQDYSTYAVFSADRKSVTVEFKDGDYGDLDFTVNSEITDPGAVAIPAASGGSGGSGGGGGCFINTADSARMAGSWKAVAGGLIVMMFFIGIIRFRKN